MSSISKPDLSTVKSKIETALQLLYKDDHCLIKTNTSERAITHKLAEYIQPLFPEWNVDCEYNRRGIGKPKKIFTKSTSYPDIIIHQRNMENNLLIIETKNIHARDHTDKKDKEKITAYIEDVRYTYQFGLWICFDDNLAKTRRDWFENSAGICRSVL